jgi:DNA-binding transcriptional LysR family regulator
MDAQKLYYLSIIIEEGSFRRAAERLSLSQPALSKSIERLENALQVKVLERSSRGVVPSAIGEILYSHARVIRDDMERAQVTVRQSVGKEVGTSAVVLGVLPTLAASIIPSAVCAWRRTDNKTDLRIVEKVQHELLIDLLRGQVDFIIGRTEYYDMAEGFKQRVLFRDRMCVFARRGHPLFAGQIIDWPDLTLYPWVCTMVGQQRNLLHNILTKRGLAIPQPCTEGTSVEFTISIVSRSDHLGMMPSHFFTEHALDRAVVPLPVVDKDLNRDIALITQPSRPLSAASSSLLQHIEIEGLQLKQR